MAAMNRRVQDRVRQRLANLRRNRLILDRTNPLKVLSGDQILERYVFYHRQVRDAPFQVAATGAEGASRPEFLCHRDISDHTGRHRENTQIHGVAVYPTGDARPDCTSHRRS